MFVLYQYHLDIAWWRHQWKHFPCYWPFVRGIHRLPVNSGHKGQWRGALMFPLICAWISVWVNNRETGDLRRHRSHYDVTIMIARVNTKHWGYWEGFTSDVFISHFDGLSPFCIDKAVRRMLECLRPSGLVQFPRRYVLVTSTLQWRQSGRVSNHQPNDCFLNNSFRRRSKKTSKLRVTGLCEVFSFTGDRWIPRTKGQ